MTGPRNLTFDDRDTAFIRYQGGWSLTDSWNAKNVEDSGTLSSTSDLNATVTFTFPTPAVAFYYYGIPRCCGGFYGICIDCDPDDPTFIDIPVNVVNATHNEKNLPVLLFFMTFKTPEIHEITIKNQNDTRSQMTIDKIDLEVNEETVPATPSAATPSAAHSSIAPPSSTTPTSTTQPNVSFKPSRSTPIGPVLGGVLGTGTLFLGLFIFGLWLRSRRKRASSISPFMPQLFFPFTPATYSLPPTNQADTAVITKNRPPARNGQGTGKRQLPLFTSVFSFSNAPLVSLPTSEPSRQPRRELDGGSLRIDEDEILPPEYSQVFAGRRV